jgi:hypothetical protein
MNTKSVVESAFRLYVLVPFVITACGSVANHEPETPETPSRTVTVQRIHDGGGTVTSTSGEITCGTTCTASVPDGTVMTLTAVPDAGMAFAGWSEPCAGTRSTCTFTVAGDITVSAAFDSQPPPDPVATLAQQAYVKASNTDSGDQFGSGVALSADGSTLAVSAMFESSAAIGVGGNQSDNAAPGAGAVYVFTRTGTAWSEQAYIKAPNTRSDTEFGFSLALSADGSTLAVGSDRENSSATGIDGNQTDVSASAAGAVYVFTRNGRTWSQQAYVKASNTGARDQFGGSLALSGDGSTMAVGAAFEASAATGIGGNQADNSASFSGAIYVFTRTGGTWRQQAYVKASNTGRGDTFGSSVALSGDGSIMAVGAIREESAATGINGEQADNSATEAGAVYMFTRTGTTWSQQAYVKGSNTGAGDRFGSSVALSNDGSSLAVGAIGERSTATGIGGDQADDSAVNAGAAYVFTRSGTSWSQQAYVKASNTEAGDQFGWAVALSGDGATLAVGAQVEASAATGIGGSQADNSAPEAGAVYSFTRSGTTWSPDAYVKASNTGAGGDRFGRSVALSGDGLTMAAGAIGESSAATGTGGSQADDSAPGAGAVYVFLGAQQR